MGHAVDEAKRERELTKEALEQGIDRFEARVRHELDWKERLRRDGPRYAVIGTVVLVGAVGLFALRATVKARRPADEPAAPPRSIADLAGELQAIRDSLDKNKKEQKRDNAPLWQKIALRGVTAAGAAAGTMIARQAAERFMPGGDEAPEHFDHR